MEGYDKHSVCAHCRDKKKGSDPCMEDQVCPHCDILTEDETSHSIISDEKGETRIL